MGSNYINGNSVGYSSYSRIDGYSNKKFQPYSGSRTPGNRIMRVVPDSTVSDFPTSTTKQNRIERVGSDGTRYIPAYFHRGTVYKARIIKPSQAGAHLDTRSWGACTSSACSATAKQSTRLVNATTQYIPERFKHK